MRAFLYILKELVPQFFSTLVVFCSVIVISQLVRLSEVLIAFGLTLENILLPLIYIVLPFMTVLLPIAALFGAMVGVSRLSVDGELTAFMTAGMGVSKISRPVLLFATGVFILGTVCAIHLEAWGRREFVGFLYRKTQTQLDNLIRFQLQPRVFVDDFLGYVFYAEEISKDRTQYKNVTLSPRKNSTSHFFLTAPRGEIVGSVKGGNLRMVLFDGMSVTSSVERERHSVLSFKRSEIDLLRVFQEQILGTDDIQDDYRSWSRAELSQWLDEEKPKGSKRDPNYLKAFYLYHSRMGSPFTAFGFVLFGLLLGIQDNRRGKGRGYAGAILVCISGYVLMMSAKWMAEKGFMDGAIAAWLPPILLFFIAAALIIRKNQLPLSESPFSIRRVSKKGSS